MQSDAQHIAKDWDWWSDFLQREYYCGPDEQKGWAAAAQEVAEAIALTPGARLLDMGSGCGEMTIRMALRGADATGVEMSTALVNHCIARAAERGVQARFIAANMFEFEPDAPLDVILSLNTSFGYGSDEQNRALIAKFGAWLAPGGVLYLDVVTADAAEEFGEWGDTVAGGRLIVNNTYDRDEQMMISQPFWIAPDYETVYAATSPEQVRIYSRADLEQMMRAAGLEPRRLKHAMGRGYDQDDDEMVTTWVAGKV
jgi:cyclopropane fatty-acyl-phospholipid synthase-like methyltransferase